MIKMKYVFVFLIGILILLEFCIFPPLSAQIKHNSYTYQDEINNCVSYITSEYNTYENQRNKKVYDSYQNAYICGAQGDIKYLHNNKSAIDVSYQDVILFVLNDDTDKMRYDDLSFVCADSAELLHNNAEQAGIKCAFVSIATGITKTVTTINGKIIHSSINSEGHALNAFNTTDKGLIYIDCTGSYLDEISVDRIATIDDDAIYYTILNKHRNNYYINPLYMNIKNIEVIW